MFNLNKKGLSGVVASVLIVLISMVSIYFLFGTVQNITAQLSPEVLSCTELQINPPMEIDRACYNTETQEIELTLSRKISSTNAELSSLEFKVNTDSETLNWHCGFSCGGGCVIQDSGTKTYYLVAENPNTLTIGINGCSPSELVEITNC